MNSLLEERPNKNHAHIRKVEQSVEPVHILIPDNLDIQSMFGGEQSKVRSRNRCQRASYLIETVTSNVAYNISEPGEYQNKDSRVWGQVIGDRNQVSSLKQDCLNKEVLECDDKYSPTSKNNPGKSYGYRLGSRYRDTGFKYRTLTDPRLCRRLLNHRQKQIEYAIRHLSCGNFLHKSQKSIHFKPEVQDFLKQVENDPTLSKKQKNCRKYTYEAFRGDFRRELFTLGRKGGRLFTNVTQLPKDLRGYLLINGESVVEIDIANSQPFLLACEFSPGDPSTDYFRELASEGIWYEALNDLLETPYQDRGDLKIATYQHGFFKNYPDPDSKEPIFNAIKKQWPQVASHIEELRRLPNRTLASKLQRIESNLVFNQCVTRIEKEVGCPIATIHDSWVVPCSKCDVIYDLLMEVITEKMGLAPKLKVKGGST
jgi:hypothetical protein